MIPLLRFAVVTELQNNVLLFYCHSFLCAKLEVCCCCCAVVVNIISIVLLGCWWQKIPPAIDDDFLLLSYPCVEQKHFFDRTDLVLSVGSTAFSELVADSSAFVMDTSLV
jgi:hypothetical protein